MYKILPILLFALKLSILASQEINYVIDINNSVDFKKKYYFQLNAQFEEYKLALEKAMTEILGNNYLINIQYNIFELIEKTGDAKQSSVRDSLYSQSKIVKKKYNNENLVVTGIGFPLEAIALGELLIEINIDEPMAHLILGYQNNSLKSSLKSAVTESYEWLFMDLEDCIDCIVMKFVDIDKFKSNSKNKQISLNRNDIYDDSWAVIIGIDKYDNLSNLDYAVADAEAVKDMLVGKFDYKEENVKLLLNEEANKTNIVNVISDVSLKAGENDRILVFYAGHGETMPLPEGGEMGYLVPIDGNQENLFASAIPMDDLKRLSNMSKAKHMLFLVDACYGGLAAVGSRGLEPAKTPNYIEKITNIKSRQIITAGGKEEKVFEKSEWGHSAYTKNLLSALEDGLADSNGDGYITADELGDYLSEKVSIDSENQQTPQSRRLTSHEGEFIFMHSENTVVIQNKSADKKLDYLISEIEELKSQKSSGDDRVVEQTVDEKEKNEYLFHSINLMGYEDNYVLGYGTSLDKNWVFSIVFTKITNKLAPVSVPENHSFTGNILGIVIGYNYWFSEKMIATIVGGVDYTTLSWNDSFLMTSGDKTLITPVTSATIAVFPFEIHNPLEMRFGFSFGLSGTLLPNSYYMEEDKVIIENMDFEIFPLASFNIMFPKNN